VLFKKGGGIFRDWNHLTLNGPNREKRTIQKLFSPTGKKKNIVRVLFRLKIFGRKKKTRSRHFEENRSGPVRIFGETCLKLKVIVRGYLRGGLVGCVASVCASVWLTWRLPARHTGGHKSQREERNNNESESRE